MSLPDGDYISIQDHLAAAIEADTGPGGLREETDPAVKTVEAQLRKEPRAYRDHEVPAIAVVVMGKEERREAGASVRNYRLAMYVYCRGLDVQAEIALCQRISSRLEDLLREENQPDRMLGDLPGALAWSAESLILTPSHTEFLTGEEAHRGQPQYAVLGLVEADLEIPASAY